jgi:hypothetical protein
MKIIKRIFSRYFDFFVALFSTLLFNLTTFYFFLKYGEPLYTQAAEAIWVDLVSFCQRDFPFYEQK